MLSALWLYVWNFDNGYIELLNDDLTFTFAFGTKERVLTKYGILPIFVARFFSKETQQLLEGIQLFAQADGRNKSR